MSDTLYTAISFAPVQGFIEKSRKLRDLFGASLILSYLSQALTEAAEANPNLTVISPALIHVQEGMPNRILIRGTFERNDVEKTLIQAWDRILTVCREWIEQNIPAPNGYFWETEWLHWKQYSWEVFWGAGETIEAAMRDLERRKLKRDWTGINWTGESSSLTGTDAIAWPGLGRVNSRPSQQLSPDEQKELKRFYKQLAWVLDEPYDRPGKTVPDDAEPEGKYIAVNERLSIPELVKRLVTFPKLAKQIGMPELDKGFKDIVRESCHWTGWFMGDGDKVGDYLKQLANDDDCQRFSQAMREWGKKFKENFPDRLDRVIYAGGDDFLGVLYSDREDSPVPPQSVFEWLQQFPAEWAKHEQPITVSVGFVWAANRVPQRDILQHCREAEKRAKSLGRNRVTIRVVFNSGQYVQWTCPWDQLKILQQYCDRNRDPKGKQNWNHIYSDWATLKARHAIRLRETDAQEVDSYLAREMLNFYFNDAAKEIEQNPKTDQRWNYVAADNSDLAIVEWIDSLIQVGWQLCSNT